MNPVTDLTLAWRGLAMTVAGKREAPACFNPTGAGLAIAILWFVVALLLSAAAQAAAVGMPSPNQLMIGFFIQAVTLAVLAIAVGQSLRFLKLETPLLALLVPIVYFMGLIQVLAIPLNLLGPNVQLVAVFVLALLIYRAARVLAEMRNGVAIAFALLCLMVLVVVPNALYMLFLQFPSPA